VSRALQDAWVARLKARDPEALREVIAAFSERITAVVAGMLRDKDAVDDVVQETFTKAWFRIQSFAGDSGLYTWLYRVAINACKDHAKGRARRPAGSLTDMMAGGEPGPSAPAAPPLEGLERRELRLAVQRAMARLPQRFRAVLALREIEGLPYQEIASVLSLSLGTVESRLFRARQRLAALLAKEGLMGTPGLRRPGGTDDIAAPGSPGS
jgi:RNA polymerase sigma-70 factor (ECF subfamily)